MELLKGRANLGDNNESSVSIEDKEFIDQLSDYQISMKFSAHYFIWLLQGLVVRVLGYRSGGPGSIPGTTRKKK
jgi:hypothetical protein